MYSNQLGLSTEVSVGPAEGLKHASSIQCDLLVSVDRSRLTDYVGSLDAIRIRELDEALQVALALEGA
jgi:mRNA interferase MazF